MSILSQPLHTFKDGNTTVAASIDNGQLVIASTGNAEHAAEGRFGQLVTVIKLQDAIAIAKAVLAAQNELVAQMDDDARFELWIQQEATRREDYFALVDDSMERDVRF